MPISAVFGFYGESTVLKKHPRRRPFLHHILPLLCSTFAILDPTFALHQVVLESAENRN
jgi:hypothetical protein